MTGAKPKRERGKAFVNGRRPEVVIAPSLLSADFADMKSELVRCRRAHADWIHIDVMDGHFVPNLAIGTAMVKAWRRVEPKLYFDTHLMVENPMEMAPLFHEAGSDAITIHIEACKDAARDLRALRRMGVNTGISIRPATPVKSIHEVLPLVDLVLVMTVEPGFGGQALIPKTLNKVRELDLLRRERELSFRLQVDGGIKRETAPLAVAAGADVLVAGSAVFGGDASVTDNLKNLREAIADVTRNHNGVFRRKAESKKN